MVGGVFASEKLKMKVKITLGSGQNYWAPKMDGFICKMTCHFVGLLVPHLVCVEIGYNAATCNHL
jgi:hypothetical protein